MKTPDMQEGVVYFVKVEGQNIFKIGYCATDLNKRMNLLRIGNPYRIGIFGIINSLCAQIVEKTLHRQFAKQRMRGEWFSISEEQASEALIKHGGTLLVPDYVGTLRFKKRTPIGVCASPNCDNPTYRTNQKCCSDKCRQFAHRWRKEGRTMA